MREAKRSGFLPPSPDFGSQNRSQYDSFHPHQFDDSYLLDQEPLESSRPMQLPTEPFAKPRSYSQHPPPTTQSQNLRSIIPQKTHTWVKVFGFDHSYLDDVLEQFQRFGEIVNYEKGRGNWLYLQYEDILHVHQALSMNGRHVREDLIVGVIQSQPELDNNNSTTQHHKPIFEPPNVYSYGSWFFLMGEYLFGS
jgi:hypothetical protein